MNAKPIYKRTWFLIVMALLLISGLGKIVEPKESPEYKACTNSVRNTNLNEKKLAEDTHKYDTDGGARLKVALMHVEEMKDAMYAGCKNQFGSR